MPSRILRLWNPDAAAWEEVGDSRLTAHLGAADPHPGYATDADLTAHAGAADPHAAYLTTGEADALFLTPTEGDARYLQTTTAASTYLPLAGGTLTGDLVLSEATPTVSLKQAADTQPRSRLSDTALAFGPGGATAPDATLSRTGAGELRLGGYLSVAGASAQVQLRDRTGDAAGYLWWVDAGAHFFYDVVQAKVRQRVGPEGTLTLTPDAGQHDVAGGRAYLRLGGTGQTAFVNCNFPAAAVHPEPTNLVSLGYPGLLWTTVYATNGTIQTSSRAVKEGITPLDPAQAMEAVRSTPAVTFTYTAPPKPPEYYDLPDDPLEAEKVLEQRARAAPLEAAARTQAGFIAEDAAPLFLTGEGQTNPSNSVGVLLAALQELDRRLTAVEGA